MAKLSSSNGKQAKRTQAPVSGAYDEPWEGISSSNLCAFLPNKTITRANLMQ